MTHNPITDIEDIDTSLFSFETADDEDGFDDRDHEMVKRVLTWYDNEKRDLPWRNYTDPYKIWISEIMLQQTRVTTVLKYYDKWIETFPDVKTLSESSIEKARSLWQGLGYYRRLEQLKKGADYVMCHFNGIIPLDKISLMKIPGIGIYTSAAISSICGGHPNAAVDGNFYRVFARFDNHLSVRPSDSSFQKKVFKRANEIISKKRPGDWNQAIMDIGSSICTPLGVRCDVCPLNPVGKTSINNLTDDSGWCRTTGKHLSDEIVSSIPLPKTKAKVKHVNEIALLMSDQKNRIVLIKRDDTESSLTGLYEIPTVVHAGKSKQSQKRPLVFDEEKITQSQLKKLSPIESKAFHSCGNLIYKFTHIEFSIDIYHLKVEDLKTALPQKFRSNPNIRIANEDESKQLPISTKIRRVIEQVSPFSMST